MLRKFRAVVFLLALSLSVSVALSQSQQGKQTPETQVAGQANAPAQLQNVQADARRDVPAELTSAVQKLQSARNDLEHGGGDWGGHKSNAIARVDEALKELQLAVEWAKARKVY